MNTIRARLLNLCAVAGAYVIIYSRYHTNENNCIYATLKSCEISDNPMSFISVVFVSKEWENSINLVIRSMTQIVQCTVSNQNIYKKLLQLVSKFPRLMMAVRVEEFLI